MKCLKKSYYKLGLLSISIMLLSSCGTVVAKNVKSAHANEHCHIEALSEI
jgi:hypothetical protein